jgi:glutamine synthetase
VTEVECLVPDLTGVARGKILPREKFTEDRGMRLPQAIVAMGVTGEPAQRPLLRRDRAHRPRHAAAPRPVHGAHRALGHRPDGAGHPRLLSTTRASWCRTRRAACLRRVCDLYAAEGWDPVVAPELEFYLTARNTDPNTPLRPPIGRSGRAETSRQAYSIDAVNEFDPLFEEIYDYCDKMG